MITLATRQKAHSPNRARRGYARRSPGKIVRQAKAVSVAAAAMEDSLSTEPQILKTRLRWLPIPSQPPTVDYWVQDGTLPVYRRGAVVRFHPGGMRRRYKSVSQQIPL